ncbi:hypothetical protein Peetri_00110 [Pseudomonas phage vB_PpuM-Peetri]
MKKSSWGAILRYTWADMFKGSSEDWPRMWKDIHGGLYGPNTPLMWVLKAIITVIIILVSMVVFVIPLMITVFFGNLWENYKRFRNPDRHYVAGRRRKRKIDLLLRAYNVVDVDREQGTRPMLREVLFEPFWGDFIRRWVSVASDKPVSRDDIPKPDASGAIPAVRPLVRNAAGGVSDIPAPQRITPRVSKRLRLPVKLVPVSVDVTMTEGETWIDPSTLPEMYRMSVVGGGGRSILVTGSGGRSIQIPAGMPIRMGEAVVIKESVALAFDHADRTRYYIGGGRWTYDYEEAIRFKLFFQELVKELVDVIVEQ